MGSKLILGSHRFYLPVKNSFINFLLLILRLVIIPQANDAKSLSNCEREGCLITILSEFLIVICLSPLAVMDFKCRQHI